MGKVALSFDFALYASANSVLGTVRPLRSAAPSFIGVLGWLLIVSEPAQIFCEPTPKVAHKLQLLRN
jgi:hypothetical protein